MINAKLTATPRRDQDGTPEHPFLEPAGTRIRIVGEDGGSPTGALFVSSSAAPKVRQGRFSKGAWTPFGNSSSSYEWIWDHPDSLLTDSVVVEYTARVTKGSDSKRLSVRVHYAKRAVAPAPISPPDPTHLDPDPAAPDAPPLEPPSDDDWQTVAEQARKILDIAESHLKE